MICAGGGWDTGGYLSPSSHHQGGAHLLMGDGAIRFVTDSIDTGNRQSPAVAPWGGGLDAGVKSPYGLFGAIGTRASEETVESF